MTQCALRCAALVCVTEGRKEGRKEGKKEKRKEGKKERRKEGKKERRKEGEKERRREGEKERRRGGEKERRREGEKERRREGEKERRREGEKEKRRKGEKERRREGEKERRREGEKERRREGEKERRREGEKERRREGEKERRREGEKERRREGEKREGRREKERERRSEGVKERRKEGREEGRKEGRTDGRRRKRRIKAQTGCSHNRELLREPVQMEMAEVLHHSCGVEPTVARTAPRGPRNASAREEPTSFQLFDEEDVGGMQPQTLVVPEPQDDFAPAVQVLDVLVPPVVTVGVQDRILQRLMDQIPMDDTEQEIDVPKISSPDRPLPTSCSSCAAGTGTVGGSVSVASVALRSQCSCAADGH